MRPDFHILLVEDSRADVKIIERALHDGNVPHRLTVLHDGRKALDYLGRLQDAKSDPDLEPDLILLDLRLPRMSGQEVLTEVKQDDDLRRIPVVIMTSSDNDRIINAVYDLHANCCVCKPVDQEEYREVVRRIERFWLSFAQRPRGA
jgi:chemotaxis family two-component system response regulator Rcp1